MAALKLVPASGDPIELQGDHALVGRDAGCDIVVNDTSVSRKHARIERWGPKWAVVDQRSANGTFLDGQRITESVIGPGQELRFGKVAYRVEIVSEESGATVIMNSPLVSDATLVQPVAPPPPRPAAPPPPVAAPPAPQPHPAPRPVAAHPPSPPAYAAHPPEPAPSGRSPLFWVGRAFATLVVIAVVGLGATMGPGYLKSRAVVEAVRAQLKEIREGDLDAAYGRNAAGYRSAHPPAAFATFVARHPGLNSNTGATFGSRTVEGGTAKLAGSLAHASGSEAAAYELVQEGGEWKISSLEVDGEEAATSSPTASATASGLKAETVAVNKVRQGQTITVKIDIRVTAFDLRPEGNAFRVDLAEDLETFGPGGRRIDELSRVDLESYNQTIPSATDAAATFNLSLTFGQPDPGRYKAVITIRDRVGQKSMKHEVPFELP
jgi:hypothetical protein